MREPLYVTPGGESASTVATKEVVTKDLGKVPAITPAKHPVRVSVLTPAKDPSIMTAPVEDAVTPAKDLAKVTA